ncbi:MAG: TAXI family TRAP transporter solute-binding subunit [Candidatus Tectomicrobia bacterium]|nr:TAXI family TRAP transporter solute-binding subunit [Candidatus Tectomicrobia bacterium]
MLRIWLRGCCMTGWLSLALLSSTQAQQLGLLTGSPTGTDYRVGQDIAAATINSGLEVVVKESDGSVDNIRRLVSQENAALAIVQSDVLGFLNWSSDPAAQRIASQLRLVFPFYDEEVHVLARKSIQRFSDLGGKRVVVGTKGSGNWMTARHMLHLLQLEPAEVIDDLAPPEAVYAVLIGKADAMFYVAGKPVTLFTNMQDLAQDPRYTDLLQNVHFVPLQEAQLLKTYSAASIGPDDYAWLSNTVPTIAIKAVLISFDFSQGQTPYSRTRCAQLATLSRALYQHLDALQRTGHPKWKEVDLTRRISIWRRDTCSQAVRRDLTRDDPVQQHLNTMLNGQRERQPQGGP